MPKTIAINVVRIAGDFTEAVPAEGMGIEGRLFGVTFEGAPEAETDIYTFPDGPKTVRNGEPQAIRMPAVGFSLRNPTFDPPGLAGQSLRFGGQLVSRNTGHVFGPMFDTITTFTHTQLETEFLHVVRFTSGNEGIRVDFVLRVMDSS